MVIRNCPPEDQNCVRGAVFAPNCTDDSGEVILLPPDGERDGILYCTDGISFFRKKKKKIGLFN